MDRRIIILTKIEKEKELLSGAFPNTITKHDNIDKWKNINWIRQEVGPVNKLVPWKSVHPVIIAFVLFNTILKNVIRK